VQWIKRKSFAKVDYSILVLGGFYILVLAIFALFEVMVINYRPVLIEGKLEASYPSSTTMLVMCVLPTAVMQLRGRIQNPVLNHSASFVLGVFTGFMVVVRLISGVHWVTDIIGGALLSTGLVVLYTAFIKLERK
jgi:undecaprenyl-diphosphatase